MKEEDQLSLGGQLAPPSGQLSPMGKTATGPNWAYVNQQSPGDQITPVAWRIQKSQTDEAVVVPLSPESIRSRQPDGQERVRVRRLDGQLTGPLLRTQPDNRRKAVLLDTPTKRPIEAPSPSKRPRPFLTAGSLTPPTGAMTPRRPTVSAPLPNVPPVYVISMASEMAERRDEVQQREWWDKLWPNDQRDITTDEILLTLNNEVLILPDVAEREARLFFLYHPEARDMLPPVLREFVLERLTMDLPEGDEVQNTGMVFATPTGSTQPVADVVLPFQQPVKVASWDQLLAPTGALSAGHADVQAAPSREKSLFDKVADLYCDLERVDRELKALAPAQSGSPASPQQKYVVRKYNVTSSSLMLRDRLGQQAPVTTKAFDDAIDAANKAMEKAVHQAYSSYYTKLQSTIMAQMRLTLGVDEGKSPSADQMDLLTRARKEGVARALHKRAVELKQKAAHVAPTQPAQTSATPTTGPAVHLPPAGYPMGPWPPGYMVSYPAQPTPAKPKGGKDGKKGGGPGFPHKRFK